VRELIAAVEAANGAPLTVREAPRRAGDPPTLVARAERVREVLGWAPRHESLEAIVTSSLKWERRIAARDPGAYWPD
jgi:UDP-glucose 4-epimerase